MVGGSEYLFASWFESHGQRVFYGSVEVFVVFRRFASQSNSVFDRSSHSTEFERISRQTMGFVPFVSFEALASFSEHDMVAFV